MKTPRQTLRDYQLLRRKYYARTIVPRCKGTDMNVLRATMRSLDMTEDYMRFRAMNVEQPLPVREDFVTRTIRSRELARVNNNLIDLLKEHKKKFTFTGLLKQLVV